jgi:hypothetical protein
MFWAAQVAEAGSFGAARAVALRYRRSLREKDEALRLSEARLREHTGVHGADEEGRQLDQREFDVTRQALQWLATVQMGLLPQRRSIQTGSTRRRRPTPPWIGRRPRHRDGSAGRRAGVVRMAPYAIRLVSWNRRCWPPARSMVGRRSAATEWLSRPRHMVGIRTARHQCRQLVSRIVCSTEPTVWILRLCGAPPSRHDRPFFRRSGLPVRVIRSKRGWMLWCVPGGGWLAPLLSPLLSLLPSSSRVVS